MNTNFLNGKEIVGPGGSVLGKAKGANFDEHTWQIESVDLEVDRKLANEIGMKNSALFGLLGNRSKLPLKVEFIGAIGDRILLRASSEELLDYVTNLRKDEISQKMKSTPKSAI